MPYEANLRVKYGQLSFIDLGMDTNIGLVPGSTSDFWVNKKNIPVYRINISKKFYIIDELNITLVETKKRIKIKSFVLFNILMKIIVLVDENNQHKQNWCRKFVDNYVLPFFSE